MNSFMQLVLLLHLVTLVVDVPRSHMKRFPFRTLITHVHWRPGNMLLLYLFVLFVYWAVVVTKHTLHHRMVQV